MPRWLDAAAQHIGRALQPMQAQPMQSIIAFAPTGMRRAALAGLAWVALPCGVLYAALAVAALADGPLLGAAVMAAFALGSAIGLVGAPMLWQRLAGMERAGSLRLAGALLVLGAGWALWHGLGEAFGMWCRSLV
jgi:sulfite exporter TauE/SafE